MFTITKIFASYILNTAFRNSLAITLKHHHSDYFIVQIQNRKRYVLCLDAFYFIFSMWWTASKANLSKKQFLFFFLHFSWLLYLDGRTNNCRRVGAYIQSHPQVSFSTLLFIHWVFVIRTLPQMQTNQPQSGPHIKLFISASWGNTHHLKLSLRGQQLTSN